MFGYVWLFVGLLALGAVPKQTVVRCPSACRCDMFLHYRRANCSRRRLVTAEGLLPSQTQILDLSYNQISHLEDRTFLEQHLLDLRLLNISHNKLSQIHMDAFVGLGRLQTLILSYNAMQYVLAHWFRSLGALQELRLRGNPLRRLGDGPLFECRSLKVLDVSACSLASVGAASFSGLSRLEQLDLSANFLIRLDVATVSALGRLRELDVAGNALACDEASAALAEHCRARAIRYNDPCGRSAPTALDRFQRIVLAPAAGDAWLVDGNDDDDEGHDREVCHGNVTSLNTLRTATNLLMRIIELSPPLALIVPFVYGICIGLVIGCSVQIGASRKRRWSRRLLDGNTYRKFEDFSLPTHLRRNERNQISIPVPHGGEGQESLMLSEWNIYETTPIVTRKAQFI